MKWKLAAALIAIICFSFQLTVMADSLRENALDAFSPIPLGPPDLKENPLTPEKVELGKKLYFDPRLSKSALISCNTCHNIGLGGADYQETSTGHGWQKGPRNSPTVWNSVFNLAQFWDGRAKDLAEQAKGPIQAGVEMNNTPDNVIRTLNSMPEYITFFQQAFPAEKDPVTFDNMAMAIEAFEATLLTPYAPFDRFLRGDETALSVEERKGLQIFMDKGCADCHGGVNMGGEDYYHFGVVEAPDQEIMVGDKGRFKVTAMEEDEYVFKSPSLRNIALTAPYFHSGRVWSLGEAVTVMGSAQLGAALSAEEVERLVDFLKSTTGRQPKIDYPEMPAATEKTPRPVLK